MHSSDLETLLADALCAARVARNRLAQVQELPPLLCRRVAEVDARLSAAALFDEDALDGIDTLADDLRNARDAERRWIQPEGAIWPDAVLTERGEALDAACRALEQVHATAAAVVDRRRAAVLASAPPDR